jgi:hypothetical protein
MAMIHNIYGKDHPTICSLGRLGFDKPSGDDTCFLAKTFGIPEATTSTIHPSIHVWTVRRISST